MSSDGRGPINVVVHPSQPVVAPRAGAVVAVEASPPRHGVQGQPVRHVGNHLPLCKRRDGEGKGEDEQRAHHPDGCQHGTGTTTDGVQGQGEGSYQIH